MSDTRPNRRDFLRIGTAGALGTAVAAFFTGSGRLIDAASAGARAASDDSPFALVEEETHLSVAEEGAPVFAYNFDMQLSDGVPERYRRSSYIHPLWGIDGTILTDDFPEDHYHHRGGSWMWPHVTVEGAEYDLWHLEGVRQQFKRWLARETTSEEARIGVENGWYVGEEEIMTERAWITTHPAGTAARALDIRLRFEALKPVELRGQEDQNKGYGGFIVRFGPRESTVITSPDGVETEDSDHKRLKWADQSGRFRGEDHVKGIAVFQHPENPNFPAEWTLRHYGLLGVAWPGTDRVTIHPGEPVTLRYRLWIHDGAGEVEALQSAYEEFSS